MIQAVEWSHVISGSMSMTVDPHILQEVAYEWAGQDLEHDPVGDLLAPFALALANATYSGRLSRTVEDEIAHDEDTWATAQLLHTGVFGTRFLLECFRTGVVDQIVEHSRYDSAGVLASEPQGDPYSLGRYWSEGEDGLPDDPKELVLNALARNPEAAREALTTALEGVEPWDQFGQQHEVTNPSACSSTMATSRTTELPSVARTTRPPTSCSPIRATPTRSTRAISSRSTCSTAS